MTEAVEPAAGTDGSLIAIYSAPSKGRPLVAQPVAELVAGRGLKGDRYFDRGPGVISMIESEAIARFNADHGAEATAPATRRCLVTRGIRLNPLVGQTFWLDGIELEGMELCDPCATLGKDLATDRVDPAAVVRAFRVSGGLRAYVRGSGTIRPGASLSLTAPD